MKFSSDDVAYAYKKLSLLKKAVTEKSQVFSRIGTRLRSLPSLYKDLGLVCMVAYLYGSAKERALDYLDTTWAILHERPVGGKSLDNLRGGGEDASYAVALALILDKVASILKMEGASAGQVLHEVLSRFGNDTVKEVLVERLVFPYTLILKKLAETMFRSKERE